MKKIKSAKEDVVFNIINYLVLTLCFLAVAYPLYLIIISSFSDPIEVGLGRVWLYPKKITFEGYKRIMEHKDLWVGYKNTLLYTFAGTSINLVLTLAGAYALSRSDMPGRNIFMGFIVFTMFFTGGLIPNYLLIKNLNLIDKFMVMVLPKAVVVWNLIIARSFFQTTIPKELREASEMDGCTDIYFFIKIVLPLSKAIIAVLTIYYAVMHWNTYFDAMIYLKSRDKYPLQLVLREVLVLNQYNDNMMEMVDSENSNEYLMIAESMKYGIIIVASLPVLALYPFLQKHFMKGVMIGAIKG